MMKGSGDGNGDQGSGRPPSNFAFVEHEWPDLYAEAEHAERLAYADPRTSCFYARRTLEFTLQWMYRADDALREPHNNDLNGMIHEPTMVNLVGPGLRTKMNLIRKEGNNAVHKPGEFASRTAVRITAELFQVMYWLARTYTGRPHQLPPSGTQFDTGSIPRPVPAEVRRLKRAELLEKEKQDKAEREALAKALAEARAKGEALEAEIVQLRARASAAKANNQARTDEHDYDEAATRDLFVDVLLKEAGWDLAADRDREFEITGLDTPSGKGRIDYVLWGDDDKPLAVVEAKRTKVDAYEGREQARRYADAVQQKYGLRPVIFYTNGYETYIWDDGNGYPPRQVQGFRTKDELHWLIRQRAGRRALMAKNVNPKIADRNYQRHAIQRVGETFDRDKQRRALLVMATGTGKTRTTVALIDLLQKANWARRVLFLADRQALVTQAVNAFKEHLEHTPTVNLLTERQTEGRVFVSTYPTMMNRIDELTQDGRRRFCPGFFDLIVIDEAHRSVYDKYGELFDYFDSLLLGLTATPKNGIDRSTYRLFQLEDGVPTDSYSLDEAVEDGFLVPPKAVDVPLKILNRGLRYDELSQEQKEAWENLEWTEDGQIPTEVTPDEINTYLFNKPTIDQALEVLMTFGHRVEGGDRIGKTIIFAKNNDHARAIEDQYNLHYPQGAGHDARVITYREKKAQQLIDDFSNPEKAPDIAISVDMLDTGIDVPEVLNLVFFKPVYSPTKFWQMIGRGTRLRENIFGPGRHKEDFYVFDLCGNVEFFNAELGRDPGRQAPSLTERVLQRQLELVRALDRRQPPDSTQDAGTAPESSTESALRWSTARRLRDTVAAMNTGNFLVRPHRREVEIYSDFTSWHRLDEEKAAEISEKLLKLPSEYRPEGEDVDEEAKRFDLTAYSLELAALEGGGSYKRLRTRVREIAQDLLSKTNIPVVREQAELLESVAGEEWWQDVTVPMVDHMRRRMRGLVRLVDERAKRNIVYTDFEDELGALAEVELKGVPQGTDEQRFRQRARAYLARHEDVPVVRKLYMNEQITEEDLSDLETVFLAESVASPEDLEHFGHRDLGLFVRGLRGLDRTAAQDAFAEFQAQYALTSRQLHFVKMIIEYVVHNGVIHLRDLYEQPFKDHGAVDGHFSDGEIDDLEVVFKELRRRAVPPALAA
ncbi:type I restriction enzyme, R subunit [Streptomyces sp. WMMB 714]|uniref:DEAD/DEAH box helicase family protein n=1 Tax=Streptomyces sp. WMMB 714 TaxID=1286822 RepID=UPI000823C8FC|nr:DEAD/DEAH box helicase family protein [Streptomyces sp. WMMB 714]SCK36185.1 type I restriction enzyme, R subunit [Streptomyces sp. WMMB 714]